MTAPPRITVVIINYNHAHHLRHALRSVLAQSVQDFEVVVVDNSSTDGSRAVVESFGDARKRVVSVENHGVLAVSRHVGLAEAAAPLVAFLDADDIWYPAKLERCLAVLDTNPAAGLVCHDEVIVYASGARRRTRYGPFGRDMYARLLRRGSCLSPSAVVLRRALYEAGLRLDEDPALSMAEDYDYWMLLARNGVTFAFLHEPLGEFQRHADSMSRKTALHAEHAMNVRMKHVRLLRVDGHIGPLRAALVERRIRGEFVYALGRGAVIAGERARAWRYLLRAVALWPFQWRAYARMVITSSPENVHA